MRLKSLLFALIIAFAIAAPARAEKIGVFVSIPPQKYFVEKIGGAYVDTRIMVTPGQNPHNYEPKPSQMAAVAKAKAYFAIGVPFEKTWLPKFAALNPDLLIVHTDHGIHKIPMAAHHHEHEHHEHEGEHHEHKDEHVHEKPEADHDHDHDHAGLDPHIWTSPVRVREIAKNTLDGLVKIDPANKAEYQKGYESFLQELDELDSELRTVLNKHQGKAFMVYHPAWGYLAHDYGLIQEPIELEGKAPKPAQLAALVDRARHLGVKVIFVQPQMSSRDAEVIAREINGRVIKADPLAENWGQNIKEQAIQFGAATR
jgi:zinc transport system substrate-binding protein